MINRRELPVAREGPCPIPHRQRMNVVHRAEREAAADIARRPFFRVQIVVVLRNRGFEHGRPKIGSIRQVLRISVVHQQAQTIRVPPPQIDIAGVVPASSGVLQQVHRAHGEGRACDRDVGGQDGPIDEGGVLIRPACLQSPRSRKGVVDEVRALQMEAALAVIAGLQRGVAPQALLQRGAPLLHVLRRRVRIEGGEAHRGLAQHRLREVKPRDLRREVVTLLGDREQDGHIVQLVAPGVHVHRSVEDAIGGAQHDAALFEVMRNAEARREAQLVRVHQAARHAVLTADERHQLAVLDLQIAPRLLRILQRRLEFVAQAEVEGGGRRQTPGILSEGIRGPVAQVHAGHAGLNLARCGKAEQEARQRGTCAVVVFRFRGEAGSELIVAAALHQRPHGPDHPLATRAELQAVAPLLPAQRFASLNGGVPLIHGRGLPGVSERRIALHIEVGRSPAFLSAEVGPGDSQRVHDVVNSVILRPVRHSQAGNADRSRIHDGGRDHLGPD